MVDYCTLYSLRVSSLRVRDIEGVIFSWVQYRNLHRVSLLSLGSVRFVGHYRSTFMFVGDTLCAISTARFKSIYVWWAAPWVGPTKHC